MQKTCTNCKKTFEKNEDNFFKKVIKQLNAKGELKTYYSFRSVCKLCHGKIGNKRRVKKRCYELNCTVSQYKTKWKQQYSKTRTLHPEISHLPKGVQSVIRKKIKNGYVFTTYKQYKTDCAKNISKAKRKYDYGDLDFVPKKTQTGIKHITDGYVALTLGMSVKDVPKQIIETKRLIIKIKRELKNN